MSDIQALTKAAADRAAKVRRAQRALDDAKAARDATILEAATAGATYPALAEATHLTRDRISQVLQERRRALTP